MGWGQNFILALDNASIQVRYRLEFIGVHNALGQPFTIYEDVGDIQIARGSIRISGTRIIPQRWSVSFGSFGLQLAGDIKAILPQMRRGQLAALLCSLNGGVYEMLAIGSLDTLSGQRGLYNLNFKDLLSTLQNSLDTRAGTAFSETDLPKFSLFYEVGQTTTTTSSFGKEDTTLNVTNASIFKKEGSKGIARITDSSNDFYVFWTGSTSTTLTGCSTADYNNKERLSSVTSGATVTYCAWLENPPFAIIAKILTSTGNGTNGTYDTYPVEWSIGGTIDKQIFDVSDAGRAAREMTRSDGGVYNLGIAIEAPLPGGFRDLIDIFSTVGIFPVYRQNAISIRACTDPEGRETRINPDLRASISDFDIIDVLQHDFFSPDIPNIYRTSAVKYNYSNSYYSGGIYNSQRVDSLPALSKITRDFSLYYLAQPDNRESQALQDLRRLRVWDLYISERLVVRLPLRFAVLCAGDIVTFISKYTDHLYDNVNKYVKGRYCMVLGCDYSIDNQECIVTLGIPSPKMGEAIDSEDTDGGYTGWLPSETYDSTDLFVWLSSDVDMQESSGNITSWTDRQNSYVFTNQVGNNNNYSVGINSPSKEITAAGHFNYARFSHTDHEFLATDFRSKMDLQSTDGICFAILIRTFNDPVGDDAYSGATYKEAPVINCGRAYQFNLRDGSIWTDAIQFNNQSNQLDQNNQFTTPNGNWTIMIYVGDDSGGPSYTGETGWYVNGTRVNTGNYAPSNFDMTIDPDFRLGRGPDIGYSNQATEFNYQFGSFDLAELLTFSIPLHDSEREKVEGYIAHKFGITSVLPASHPYKTTVPT